MTNKEFLETINKHGKQFYNNIVSALSRYSKVCDIEVEFAGDVYFTIDGEACRYYVNLMSGKNAVKLIRSLTKAFDIPPQTMTTGNCRLFFYIMRYDTSAYNSVGWKTDSNYFDFIDMINDMNDDELKLFVKMKGGL